MWNKAVFLNTRCPYCEGVLEREDYLRDLPADTNARSIKCTKCFGRYKNVQDLEEACARQRVQGHTTQ